MSFPRVALESTVLAHGLPHPHNHHLAHDLDSIVRDAGAIPITIGYINGVECIGLSDDEISMMCVDPSVQKVSIRDIPRVVARGLHGATTVATTIRSASRAGINVMATGGIGGVHRDAQGQPSSDISADLRQLALSPMTVVCSGPKAILHLEATREHLESLGISVVGYKTDTMPAFYCENSPYAVDVRCDTPSEIADLTRARDAADLPQSILVVNPLPASMALSFERVQEVVTDALSSTAAQALKPAEVTPFLLNHVRQEIGDRALTANVELLKRNAALAATIASELH
jgi:pseudouridine-5'-phosphate glycosidase